jgi:hypothetical protein
MKRGIMAGVLLVSVFGVLAAESSVIEQQDMADSLLKVGGEQVPVALTPMTLYPWLPVSAEYVREHLVQFLNAAELELLDKAIAVLRVPVRSLMYQSVVTTCNVLATAVKKLKVDKAARKQRHVALTALATLRDDVKSAIRVLEKRQRLFLRGKDLFATVDYRKVRVEREKSFKNAGKAVTAAAAIASVALILAIVKTISNYGSVTSSQISRRS